jgi:type III secretion protein J
MNQGRTLVRTCSARASARTLLLCALILVVAGCGREVLYAELPEQQANRVQAALLEAGIDASKSASASKKGWTISLPREQFGRAMSELEARGLPGEARQTLGDVFKREGITSSPKEEQARFIFAREQELASAFEAFDGILEAHVIIHLPERSPLADVVESPSAMVSLIHDPHQSVLPTQQEIEALVMDAVGIRPGEAREGAAPTPPRITVTFAAREPRAHRPAPTPVLAGAAPTPILAGTLALLLLAGIGFGWRTWQQRRSHDAVRSAA